MIDSKSNNSPIVSIVSANYNKSTFVSEFINSVIKQTYQNWELIIVDDKSTDSSVDIISSFVEKDERIKLIVNSQNKGANFCRNKGIDKSIGEFIVFADSDDILDSFCIFNRVANLYKFIENDLWIFPMGTFHDKIGDSTSCWINFDTNHLKRFLTHDLPWSIIMPIWRKSVLKSLNGFSEDFNRLQDVELHTRALISGVKVKTFPLATLDCYYRISEERLNLNQFKFHLNFINGIIQYINKFYPLLNGDRKYLNGSLLEALSTVLNSSRNKLISKKECVFLLNELRNDRFFKKKGLLFNIYILLNTISPVHPKGLKYIFKKILI